MRTLLTAVSALVFLACPVPATAGVVYNWVELEQNSDLGQVSGRIEFRDEVWKLGSYVGNWDGPYNIVRPSEFGITSMLFQADRNAAPFYVDSANTVPCVEPYGHAACSLYGIDDDELVVRMPFVLNISVQFGDLLSGVIYGIQSPTEGYWLFNGSLSSQIISHVQAGNDGMPPTPCTEPLCLARGVWLLDRTTIPIPEPAAIAFLLLCLVASMKVRTNGLEKG